MSIWFWYDAETWPVGGSMYFIVADCFCVRPSSLPVVAGAAAALGEHLR